MAENKPSSLSFLSSLRNTSGNLIGELLFRLLHPSGAGDEASLKKILQSHPCWARGHLMLGEIQLARKEKRGAYACALAAGELKGAKTLGPALLMARVYLQSGRESEAVELLEQVSPRYPGNSAMAEELAAGYMHQGRNDRALVLLSGIPQTDRSPSVNATLAYLQREAGK